MRTEHTRTQRSIIISAADLVEAFDDASDMLHYYLDLTSGAVIAVTEETRDALNAIYATLGEDYDDQAFAAALVEHAHPDWMQEVLTEAHQVEQGYGTRYIAIPQTESRDSYHVMEAFIETVADQRFQARLAYAIQGRGAFRRFKDTLLTHPDERERWFAFKTAHARERMLTWLKDEGIAASLE